MALKLALVCRYGVPGISTGGGEEEEEEEEGFGIKGVSSGVKMFADGEMFSASFPSTDPSKIDPSSFLRKESIV